MNIPCLAIKERPYVRFDIDHQSIQFFRDERSILPIRFANGADRFVSGLVTDKHSCTQIADIIAAISDLKIQAGYQLRFDMRSKTIQFFPAPQSTSPIRFANDSLQHSCDLITDADSCFQLAGIIAAVLGHLIGEGVLLDDTITYEFKRRG